MLNTATFLPMLSTYEVRRGKFLDSRYLQQGQEQGEGVRSWPGIHIQAVPKIPVIRINNILMQHFLK